MSFKIDEFNGQTLSGRNIFAILMLQQAAIQIIRTANIEHMVFAAEEHIDIPEMHSRL
jgi:hypothetical protein